VINIGDVVDGKYRVDGLCSDSGGMGTVLFVTPLTGSFGFNVVLKFCKNLSQEELLRFCREVRLLASCSGNSKIVHVVDYNVSDHDPPYFIMKYYPDGDLSKIIPTIQASPELQETVFLQMIDCIYELHSRNMFHRDIKPQNFLIDGNQLVLSDFGLSTEVGSSTGFTRTSMYWGTQGFIPPEFLSGGFKHVNAASDIFMLGKTMYVLVSNRNPMYPVGDNILPQVFFIIERCCHLQQDRRYQSLAELRQTVVSAFDVLLGRASGVGSAKQLLSQIASLLKSENKYIPGDLAKFIEIFAVLNDKDKVKLSFEMPKPLFSVLGNTSMATHLPIFLSAYSHMVETKEYGWSYAETIAENMREIFYGSMASITDKGTSLELAIKASIYMNRFAAMDTCREMIVHVSDEKLGFIVARLVLDFDEHFIRSIEPSECKSDSVANAIRQIRESEKGI